MTDIVKKEKKVMTPERLEQLARARKKAQEIKAAGAILKMEAKIANITKINETEEAPNFQPTPAKEIENKIIKAELIDNPVTQEYVPEFSPRVDVQPPQLTRQPAIVNNFDEFDEEEEQPLRKVAPNERVRDASRVKSKKPLKTKIVIEQSSDDEDEFHPHEHVIFVKRKSKNDSKPKIIPAETPPPPTSPVRGQRENMVLQQHQEKRQLPTFPLPNTMDDFINQGFTNYRKYY